MVVPLQMAVSAMVFTVGCCNMVTVTLSLAVHCLAEATVTTYFVVAVGLATGLYTVVSLKPAFGLQAYDVLPAAVATSCTDDPAQMAVSLGAFTVGDGLTDTVTESLAEHCRPGFTVITYLVVAIGVASGLSVFALERPVAGDQL